MQAVGAVIVDEDNGGALGPQDLLLVFEDRLGVEKGNEPGVEADAVFGDEADGIVVGSLGEGIVDGHDTRRVRSEIDEGNDDECEDERDKEEAVEESAGDAGKWGTIFDLQLAGSSPEANVGEHRSADKA